MRTRLILLLCGLLPALAGAEQGRLLATGGATSIDGAAGGGIVPWAVLAGYGEEGEWGATSFLTRVETGDYRLDVGGLAVSYGNRVELSYARQRFDLGTLARDLTCRTTASARTSSASRCACSAT